MKASKVHFIGIGGIGTSALARWFLSHNYNVSGSDASSSEITSELKKQGIRVFIGHQAKNVPKGANLAIFSAAVPIDNPERRQAVKLGISTKSYSEAVADLVKQYKTLAVTGAHGKSTTTALLSLVLIKAGFDPTVIIGTKLKEFSNSNFRNGKGDYLVLEADEYQKSFLNYSPTAAIILNIDAEHLDYYKNLINVKNAFLKFIKNIQPNGILILNKDDKNLFSLKNKIQKIAKKKKVKIFWYSIGINQHIYQHTSASLKILGEHNISNALAVYTLTKALNIKEKDIFNAISHYRGAWRRMEYRGQLKTHNSKLKAKIYDDYAHHPTEIKATLAGIAKKWPKTGLICVFQPHQAKRLSLLFKDFMGAFDSANALILLPVYQVRGRDSSTVAKYLSQKLAEAIKKRTNQLKTNKLKTIIYLPSPKKLRSVLAKIIYDSCFKFHDSCIIVMMGAGDIYKLTDKLVK
jgi:UDP-N-acetylmuramate--alanine ligase